MATFEFQNPSGGSAYFFLETITTSSLYPIGTPKYMEGTWNVNGVKTNAFAYADMTLISESYDSNGSGSISINTINFVYTGSAPSNTNDTIYLDVTAFVDTTITGFLSELNTAFYTYKFIAPYDTPLSNIDIDPSTYSPQVFIYYVGTNQDEGNTIPYAVNGVSGILSGGLNYNFGLVTSSFIAGVVIQPGYSSFEFIPNITIPVGAIEFRGTGEYTVTITP
jgi:hypothetical protein